MTVSIIIRNLPPGKPSLSQGVHLVLEAVEEGGAEEELRVDPLLLLLAVEQEDVTAHLPGILLA